MKELGFFLKRLRMESRLCQVDVAKALVLQTSQFISNWERGLSCPPPKAVKKLAELYDANPDSLSRVIKQALAARYAESLSKRYDIQPNL